MTHLQNHMSLCLLLVLVRLGLGRRGERSQARHRTQSELGFSHLAYAQLLSHLGRHQEALTEARRARSSIRFL